MSRQLTGGSQGDEGGAVASYDDGFFQTGVNYTQITGKSKCKVRLLPAFDGSYSVNDDAYKTGFVGYRSQTGVDELTDTEAFTPWYFTFMTYSFWGAQKRRFLSPLTGYAFPYKKGIDPIYDMFIKVKHGDDKTLKEKLLKSAMQDDRPLFFPGTQAIANGLVEDDKTNAWKNEIVMFTNSALKELKQALTQTAGRDDPVISKEWPNYMLGDITHPASGCILVPTQRQVHASGPPSACLAATHNPRNMKGYTPMAIDVASDVGKAQLAGRRSLTDDVNTLKFVEYQQIVEWAIEDNIIPYELIADVCGPHTPRMPEAKGKTTVSSPAQEPKKEEPSQAATQQNAIADSIQKPAEVEDDIPMGDAKTETPAGDPPAGDDPAARARFEELDAKIKAGETADSNDVMEWAKLNDKFGKTPATA